MRNSVGGLQQGCAAPASPRPHPNPLPAGEGAGGERPSGAARLAARALSQMRPLRNLRASAAAPSSPRPHPNPLPAVEGVDPRPGPFSVSPGGAPLVTGGLRGRAAPASPRPHPNPLPEVEGAGGEPPPLSGACPLSVSPEGERFKRSPWGCLASGRLGRGCVRPGSVRRGSGYVCACGWSWG